MVNVNSLQQIFRKNLNDLILRKGITQKELADFMEVSPATVNDWVKGKKMPRMNKLDKLCAYFNVERSELMENQDEKRDIELSEAQIKLVEEFNALNDDGKKTLWNVLQSLRLTHRKSEKSSTLPLTGKMMARKVSMIG